MYLSIGALNTGVAVHEVYKSSVHLKLLNLANLVQALVYAVLSSLQVSLEVDI
jgi:hypothetical protein